MTLSITSNDKEDLSRLGEGSRRPKDERFLLLKRQSFNIGFHRPPQSNGVGRVCGFQFHIGLQAVLQTKSKCIGEAGNGFALHVEMAQVTRAKSSLPCVRRAMQPWRCRA